MADEQRIDPTEPLPAGEETERITTDAGTSDETRAIDAPSGDETLPGSATATLPLPEAAPAPEATPPEAATVPDDATHPEGADATPSDQPAGNVARIQAFLAQHRRAALSLTLVGIATALGLVLLGLRLADVPPDELIRADAQTRLTAPAHTVGDYGTEDPLILDSVEIGRKQMSGTRRDACEVTAVATFSNAALETRADATLTYVRQDGDWSCTAATTDSASHHAKAGIDPQRAIDRLDALLQMADEALGDDGGTSLVNLYHDAEVTVVDQQFDEEGQTEDLTLHCSKATAFVSYECDLTATFRFAAASGAWELRSARVSDTARDLGFKPLVGTWIGTFRSQESRSGKCLAAREVQLVVNIARAAMAADGGATIEGTVSGVIHPHADAPEDDEATAGDQLLDNVPFTGAIASDETREDLFALLTGTSSKKNRAGIVFECTTQDTPDSTVTLTLEFGSAKAPDAATATLTTTHPYEDFFLMVVPYQRESRYADTYSLEKR